jgi:catalase
MSQKPTLTTSAGAPIADNQNSFTAGAQGPLLMKGLGRVRHIHRDSRHHPVHESADLFRGGQAD